MIYLFNLFYTSIKLNKKLKRKLLKPMYDSIYDVIKNTVLIMFYLVFFKFCEVKMAAQTINIISNSQQLITANIHKYLGYTSCNYSWFVKYEFEYNVPDYAFRFINKVIH